VSVEYRPGLVEGGPTAASIANPTISEHCRPSCQRDRMFRRLLWAVLGSNQPTPLRTPMDKRVITTDALRSSTGVAAGQRMTGLDKRNTRFERPRGRNVDGSRPRSTVLSRARKGWSERRRPLRTRAAREASSRRSVVTAPPRARPTLPGDRPNRPPGRPHRQGRNFAWFRLIGCPPAQM
jgi:hypothetical protein